jgi:hypothetical protein
VKVELRLIELSAVKTIVSESRVVLETSYDSVHTIFCCWFTASKLLLVLQRNVKHNCARAGNRGSTHVPPDA